MNRRAFAGGVGSLLACGLAGCFGFGSGGTGYHLRLERVPRDDVASAVVLTAAEQSADQRELVANATSGEHRAYGYRPVEAGEYVEYEGRYYRIEVEETGEKTLTRTTLRGEVVENLDDETRAVEMTAYPRSDYEALRFAVASAEARARATERDERPSEEDGYVFRGRDSEESELLPEPEHEYVKHDDRIVRLVVADREVTETEYTFTTEAVADSDDEFRRLVREKFVAANFEREGLTEKQRRILGTAIDDEYDEFGDLSEDYRTLLERIGGGELPMVTPESDEQHYVSYEGRFYEVRFTKSVP